MLSIAGLWLERIAYALRASSTFQPSSVLIKRTVHYRSLAFHSPEVIRSALTIG